MNKKNKTHYKMIDLFSGIGGIRLGFEQAGNVKTVFSSDIDSFATKTYKENFGDDALCDITKVKEKDLPDFDILTGGFPYKGKTFKIILSTLEGLGYDVYYQILNTCIHGNIPQNRERIYIVGFRKDLKVSNFQFPNEIPLTNSFLEFIPRNHKQENRYYYDKRFSIYPEILKAVISKKTAYQWRRVYVRVNKRDVSPTLTANMGTGGHNVPLIKDNYGIRKLTPRECFKLQGFPETYKFPEKMSDSKLYKQAGNSVSVSVIKRIAEKIFEVLDKRNIND